MPSLAGLAGDINAQVDSASLDELLGEHQERIVPLIGLEVVRGPQGQRTEVAGRRRPPMRQGRWLGSLRPRQWSPRGQDKPESGTGSSP
jgi:hypothetical protein